MTDRMPVAPARLTLFVAITTAVIIFDQWSKALVREHVGAPRSYANGWLTLLRAENSGAFLSLGAELPQALRTIVFGVVVFLLLVMFTTAVVRGSMARMGETAAAAMIIGGGFGNLIDRALRNGHVTDFLYLQAGPLHTGVFNVADMAITGGVIWLIALMRTPKRSSPP